MSTLTIDVTDFDITIDRDDRLGDPATCMVAQAVRRRLDLTEDAEVSIGIGNDSNYLRQNGKELPIKLTKSVQGKIIAWDEGKHVKPFTFDVEFPDDWREQLKAK